MSGAVQVPSSASLRPFARVLIAVGVATLVGAFLQTDRYGRVSLLLAGAAVVEIGGFLAVRSRGPVSGLHRRAPAYCYLLAVAVAGAYVGLTLLGNPTVRTLIGVAAPIKVLAILAAAVGGTFEETLFRGVLMDRLQRAGRGAFVQVFVSGVAFGIFHFYAFAGLQGALAAQAATTVLGWGLGALYIWSGRSLWPCAAAHIIIDVVLEPALLLSMIR